MIIRNLGIATFLAQCLSLSSAFEHHSSHLERRQFITPADYTGPTVPSYNISIPVDHFNKSDTRTYENRYWVNDTYYKPGGPVFYFDIGEEGISEALAAQKLASINCTSVVMKLAQEHNGIAVLLEHRYFGYSYPIPLNTSTFQPEGGLAGFQYLTVEQALEDVVYFANNWKQEGWTDEQNAQLSPCQTPWILVGGSYSGARVAFLRVRNPDLFYASWASSAVVEMRVDGSIYFDPIQASLPSNCSADAQAIVKYADEIMSGDYGTDVFLDLARLTTVAFGTQFGLNSSYDLNETQVPVSIASTMKLIWGTWFQTYGPPNSTDLFCTWLESYNPHGQPSNTTNPYIEVMSNPGNGMITDAGIVATYNVSVGLDAFWYAWRNWFQWLLDVGDPNFAVQDPISPTYIADGESWDWIVVTEAGFFQGANPTNISIVSTYSNYTIVQDNIISFEESGPDDNPDLIPAEPDINAFNMYGGFNMSPSNVMFTVGQYDPWRGTTVLSNMTWTGAPIRDVTQDIPACGQSPEGTDVFGLVYPGYAHEADLGAGEFLPFEGTNPSYVGYELFSKALEVWLPCFKGMNSSMTI